MPPQYPAHTKLIALIIGGELIYLVFPADLVGFKFDDHCRIETKPVYYYYIGANFSKLASMT